jgi:hypothetical protein
MCERFYEACENLRRSLKTNKLFVIQNSFLYKAPSNITDECSWVSTFPGFSKHIKNFITFADDMEKLNSSSNEPPAAASVLTPEGIMFGGITREMRSTVSDN